MKHFLRIALCLLGMALLPGLPVQAQNITNATVAMSDGVQLDILYVRPLGTAPTGGWPGMLLVHGFAGSKNEVANLAMAFAMQGYYSVGYSVRGQGASGGVFDFFTSQRILDDLREMIAYLGGNPEVNADRLGVLGASQGGLHAWNAAAYKMPVRTAVSIIANGRAADNWLENGALSWIFSNAGLTPNVRFDPAVRDSLAQARQKGDFTYVRSFFEQYSTTSLESDVRVPVLIAVSAHDIFFNQNAAMRQFANVPTDSRIILYPGGHDLPPVQEQEGYVLDVVYRWLDYWLRDVTADASVASPDSAVALYDGGTGALRIFSRSEEGVWLAPTPNEKRVREEILHFSGFGLTPDAPQQAGQTSFTYVPLLGSQPIAFQSEPFARDLTLAPLSGTATMYCSGTGHSYQMNVSLYDFDPVAGRRTPIARGHMQVKGVGGDTRLMQFELTRILHTIKAGHVLEAQVHPGLALIPDLNIHFGNIVNGPVDASVNVLSWGGPTPSLLRLWVFDENVNALDAAPAPTALAIGTNYPNPFSSFTHVPVEVAAATTLRVRVYNSAGKLVATLHDGTVGAGRHSFVFDAAALPAGVYLCRAESAAGVAQRAVLLLR
ncbi:MAG TPA: CocE/NonD family hydrolase [Bacteroidota bacterium]|nr:CocE/NonD family hydrolase [Bacteroidota bacterium]